MWIEAIITKEDLIVALSQLLPVRIHFDDDPKTDRWLYLGPPTEIELIADKGLRVACPAEVMWSVVGIDLPIKIHTLQVVLRPDIVSKPTGDVLAFNITLEEADFKGIPALIDHGIMKAINGALESKNISWDFTKSLSQTVKMPKLLDPIESLSIKIGWGKRRIDAEAIVLAVSFHLTLNRDAGHEIPRSEAA